MLIPVILSGGSGTRLWPVSRAALPKQFRSLIGPKTLIQETATRLASLPGVGSPIVVCGESHTATVLDQLRADGTDPTIIVEPSARNTAPAVAAACLHAVQQDADATVAILPSDHVISDVPEFARLVGRAVDVAAAGHLTTFGVVPTYPATGYGYIQPGAPIDADTNKDEAFVIEAFVEKPDLVTAAAYRKAGFLWNAGIFLFRAADFLDELAVHEPQMFDLVSRSHDRADQHPGQVILAASPWDSITAQSIDYAVMERTDRGAVLPLSCGWSDIGSWTALHDLSERDADGNTVSGEVYATDVAGSFIRTESKPIVALGIRDLIIVETEDAILVMHRDADQNIKNAIERLPDQLR